MEQTGEMLKIKGLGEHKVKLLKAIAELERRIYEVDFKKDKAKIT